MPQAFVLMNAELGSEDSIVQELKKLEGVKEVFQVYGVYDIVAQLEADTMEKVKWSQVHLDNDSNVMSIMTDFYLPNYCSCYSSNR